MEDQARAEDKNLLTSRTINIGEAFLRGDSYETDGYRMEGSD